MFHGFAKRIEELEKQISSWEIKAKKDDKWKKCMESWLLKNFDFDIQEDISKFSDSDEPEEEERKSDYSQAYEEPVISSYISNNFHIAPREKQVYNNPHLIIESQSFNSSEETKGQQQSITKSRSSSSNQLLREDFTEDLQPEPAHLNSLSLGVLQKRSYDNSRSNIISSKERSEHKRKPVNLAETRNLPDSTPVSLQKIDSVHEYTPTKMRLSHGHSGSNITLTPLPLTSSSTVNSESGGFGIGSDKNSSPRQNNNTSAHYLSNNNHTSISHNVTSLITNKPSSHPLKEEDNEQEQEWHEEDDCVLPHYNTGQLEIRRQNINHERSEVSSEGRNSITSISEDIEEISNDTEDHHNADNLNLSHIPGVLSSGDMFKGGTNFFSNPKNLPICSFCGKSYSSQTYLKTHIDVVHKGMKAYRCKLCGVSFGFKSDLTRHLRSHLKRKTSVV